MIEYPVVFINPLLTKNVAEGLNPSLTDYKSLCEDVLGIFDSKFIKLQNLVEYQNILTRLQSSIKQNKEKEELIKSVISDIMSKFLDMQKELMSISGIIDVKYHPTGETEHIEIWAISELFDDEIMEESLSVWKKYGNELFKYFDFIYAGKDQFKDYDEFFSD